MVKETALVVILLSTLSCQEEKKATVEGPPLTAASASSTAAAMSGSASPSSASAASASASKASPPPAPTASLVDVPAAARPFDLCDKVIVAVTKGKVTALDEALSVGDLLLAEWVDTLALGGKGQAMVASVKRASCGKPTAPTTIHRVVRATAAPELAWAGGQMKAHADVEKEVLPELYVGRLEGTLPVPEHSHPGTWEVLCAVQAAGTLTINGEDKRVSSGACITVPPDTKHAWKPDAGSKLVAVQMYAPPGPEQRFKKLAAEAADAGPVGR